MIINAPQADLVQWLCYRIGYNPTKHMTAIGEYDPARDLITGVVGYDGWSKNAVEMHAAGDGNWLSREMLYRVFHYPFVSAGVNVIFCRVDASDEATLEFDRKVGFVEQCRLRGGSDDGDMVILAMYKGDCKWLKVRHNHLEKTAMDTTNYRVKPTTGERPNTLLPLDGPGFSRTLSIR